MTKKIFLTSFFAMGCACSAMAAVEESVFPDASKGYYMLPDRIYTNSAIAANMDGVYQDGATVYAIAQYDVTSVPLPMGYYLPKSSEIPAVCPAGSYCPGGSVVSYSATADQGKNACSNGYTSDAGAMGEWLCYLPCTATYNGRDIVAHASAVTGGFYTTGDVIEMLEHTSSLYSSTTCSATACEPGYHLAAATMDGVYSVSNMGSWSSEPDDVSGVYGAIKPDGTFVGGGDLSVNQSKFGISVPGTFAYTSGRYSYGTEINAALGEGKCGALPTIQQFGTLDGEVTGTGGHCFCRLTGHFSGDGNGHGNYQPYLTKWVYIGDGGTSDFCESYCAESCGRILAVAPSNTDSHAPFYHDNSGRLLRDAFADTANLAYKICEPNTINISWENATSGGSNSVTYGGDITTPEGATAPAGKTFVGWKFSHEAQSSN